MGGEGALKDAAAMLRTVRSSQRAIDELPAAVRPTTLADAYKIQALLNQDLRLAGFGAEVGYKIGCTTPVMQEYLGIAHPCVGSMFATMLHRGHGDFGRADLCRPGVECEIAVVIGRDMVADAAFTAEAAAQHVAAAMASIELVDDRWTDFRSATTPSLVADNFFNAGCVVGEPTHLDPATLDEVHGAMWVNGTKIGSGAGSDILGHPMAALAWLASHLSEVGTPLRAGAIVTLGSMVETAWIDTGDRVEVEATGLGRCSLRLE